MRRVPACRDVARLLAAGARPRVMLALLAADGAGGLLGRGVLEPGPGLWQQAAAAHGG
jgi:hypothetical protein